MRITTPLLGGRITLHQLPRSAARVSFEPVLLAAAVQPPKGARILDAGAGTGAAGLCLAWRFKDIRVIALEKLCILGNIIKVNIHDNNMQDQVHVIIGDLSACPLKSSTFDWVITNPPFHDSGTQPLDKTRREGRMIDPHFGLIAWFHACIASLRPRGRLASILSVSVLDKALAALNSSCMGEVTLFPIWRRQGDYAHRIILTARQGVRTQPRLLSGMSLHGPCGELSEDAEAVLRYAKPIILSHNPNL